MNSRVGTSTPNWADIVRVDLDGDGSGSRNAIPYVPTLYNPTTAPVVVQGRPVNVTAFGRSGVSVKVRVQSSTTSRLRIHDQPQVTVPAGASAANLISNPPVPTKPLEFDLTVGTPKTLWLYGLDRSQTIGDPFIEVDAQENRPDKSKPWIVADVEPVSVLSVVRKVEVLAPENKDPQRNLVGICESVSFTVSPRIDEVQWTCSGGKINVAGQWRAPLEPGAYTISTGIPGFEHIIPIYHVIDPTEFRGIKKGRLSAILNFQFASCCRNNNRNDTLPVECLVCWNSMERG